MRLKMKRGQAEKIIIVGDHHPAMIPRKDQVRFIGGAQHPDVAGGRHRHAAHPKPVRDGGIHILIKVKGDVRWHADRAAAALAQDALV